MQMSQINQILYDVSLGLNSQVKELVSLEQFLRYDRLLLQSSLDNMSDIVYCPRKPCGCAVMVDQIHNMASCSACHYTFCIFCKLVFHGVSPCKIRAGMSPICSVNESVTYETFLHFYM